MRIWLILLLNFTASLLASDYTLRLVTGDEINLLLPSIAQQWIATYAHYPYLYKGTLTDGMNYFKPFTTSPHAALVVAYDQNNNIIGFISGILFADFAKHHSAVQELFVSSIIAPDLFYYISDVMVVPAYRHRGIAKDLFKRLEAYAASLGYVVSCLLCESHPAGHPQKPKDYYELDNVWKKVGYSNIMATVSFVWETIQSDGSTQLEEHVLTCWIKELKNN